MISPTGNTTLPQSLNADLSDTTSSANGVVTDQGIVNTPPPSSTTGTSSTGNGNITTRAEAPQNAAPAGGQQQQPPAADDRIQAILDRMQQLHPIQYKFLTEYVVGTLAEAPTNTWENWLNPISWTTETGTLTFRSNASDYQIMSYMVRLISGSPEFEAWLDEQVASGVLIKRPLEAGIHSTDLGAAAAREAQRRTELYQYMKRAGATESEINSLKTTVILNDVLGPGGYAEQLVVVGGGAYAIPKATGRAINASVRGNMPSNRPTVTCPGPVDVALGLDTIKGKPTLDEFAKATGAFRDNAWKDQGLHNAAPGRFDLAFKQTLDKVAGGGGRIKFNLDSLDIPKALAGDPADRVGRYTEWELQQIVRNQKWYDSTDFYLNGRMLTPAEVKQLGL